MKQVQPNPAGLSVVVPTLNEADTISSLLHRIHTPLAQAGIPHEILVIDDHSSDDTIKLAHAAPSSYCVRVLSKQGSQGKAYSLLEGFAAAEHDVVAMIDADLQYPPEALRPMYDRLHHERADVVITERIQPQTSWFRRLSTRVFNLVFARLLFGIAYDTQSGLKLFRKSVLSQYHLNPSPWSFDLEFIVRAIEQKHSILNHKILFAERQGGQAKLRTVSATFELISASLRLRRDSSIRRFGMGGGSFGLSAAAGKLYQRASHRPLAVCTGVLCALALSTSLAPASVSALSVPGVNTVTQLVRQVLGDDGKKKTTGSGTGTGSGTSSGTGTGTGTTTTTPPTSTTSGGASTTTSSSSTGTTGASTPTTTPATSTASTPTTSPTATTGATATTAAATFASTSAKTAASAAAAAKATQATVTDNASSIYYNTSPLSAKKHNLLTGWAIELAIVGISLVILAGLITLMHMFRNAIRRTSAFSATRILQQGSAPPSS